MKYVTIHSAWEPEHNSLVLQGADFHHIVDVLRYKRDDVLLLRRVCYPQLYRVVIRRIDRRQALLTFLDPPIHTPPLEGLQIHLWLPWLKREALEVCLKQAVEVGVGKITLVRTDFSVADKGEFVHKRERHDKILEQAGEQSGNPFVPSVCIAESLEELVAQKLQEMPLFFAHHEKPERSISLGERLGGKSYKACCVLVGPEGGLSSCEVALLEREGGFKVFFNAFTLRSQTASLYLMSTLKSIHNEVLNGQ